MEYSKIDIINNAVNITMKKYDSDLITFVERNNIKERIRLFSSLYHQLVKEVSYIHSYGLVHGDIKPDNILFDRSNDTFKLIDFGNLIKVGEYHYSRGSIPYAPPEFIKINNNALSNISVPYVGFYTDYWSLGLTLASYLTGINKYYDHVLSRKQTTLKKFEYDMSDIYTVHAYEKFDDYEESLLLFYFEIINDMLHVNPFDRKMYTGDIVITRPKFTKIIIGKYTSKDIVWYSNFINEILKHESHRLLTDDLLNMTIKRLLYIVDQITITITPDILIAAAVIVLTTFRSSDFRIENIVLDEILKIVNNIDYNIYLPDNDLNDLYDFSVLN